MPRQDVYLFGSPKKISFGEKQIEEEIDLDESKEELLIANNVRYARDHSISILQIERIR